MFNSTVFKKIIQPTSGRAMISRISSPIFDNPSSTKIGGGMRPYRTYLMIFTARGFLLGQSCSNQRRAAIAISVSELMVT